MGRGSHEPQECAAVHCEDYATSGCRAPHYAPPEVQWPGRLPEVVEDASDRGETPLGVWHPASCPVLTSHVV